MKAVELYRAKVVYSQAAFAEAVLWQVAIPLPGSAHNFKYRLAYVVNGVCVIRYDNEAGKGDHKHHQATETKFSFMGPAELGADHAKSCRLFDVAESG